MSEQSDIYAYTVLCMPSLSFCQQIYGTSVLTGQRQDLL